MRLQIAEARACRLGACLRAEARAFIMPKMHESRTEERHTLVQSILCQPNLCHADEACTSHLHFVHGLVFERAIVRE